MASDKTLNFIDRAREVHGNKYDYSKAEYVNCDTKVCIICPEHGEFMQTPYHHINRKQGCRECAKIKSSLLKRDTFEQFVEKARQVHGNKYDYSKVEYLNNHTKICIICPIHGEFLQTPNQHLSNKGCPKCVGKNKTTKDFINEARQIHGNKYDYSKVAYINAATKICITCPKHGGFWQTPNKHLQGRGCPKCKVSYLEREIRHFLDKHNIESVEQKTFPWLKKESNLFLDFYLPQYNIGIECQGIQHFEPSLFIRVDKHKAKDVYEQTHFRDIVKHQLCCENKVTLLYYTPSNRFDTFLNEKIYHSTDELLTVIHNIK